MFRHKARRSPCKTANSTFPENPIIPYIEGDGIGVDVTPAMLKVVDAAVEKAYKGERKIFLMGGAPVKNDRFMVRTSGCLLKPLI
ncbi:hypothetical protein ACLB1S_12850 [Escherichia coli]